MGKPRGRYGREHMSQSAGSEPVSMELRVQRHRIRRDRGNGAFGQSDIEGKAAMGSGEWAGKQTSFNRAGRRKRS
jgi:hypothetical protein